MQYTNPDRSISSGVVPEMNGAAISLTNPLGIISAGFQDHYGTQQYIAPNGELVTVPLYKLVGDAFFGTVLDTNIWEATPGTGNISVSGQLVMQTGTTANGAAYVRSVHPARFSGLAPNKCRIPMSLPDGGTVNNVREWGVAVGTANSTVDAAFFRIDGPIVQCVVKKGSVETVVATAGNMNGQFGTTFTAGRSSHFYEVVYQPRQVQFLADNKIVHIHSAAADIWANTLHLGLWFANYNKNGSTTNVTMNVRLGTIASFGIPQKQVSSYYQQGATANGGVILKVGPGNLHIANLSNVPNGASMTLYDGTSNAGSIIDGTGAMGPQTSPLSLPYAGKAFDNGLFLSTVGAMNASIIFD